MFCWYSLGSGIHVDVALTCATCLNIVTNHSLTNTVINIAATCYWSRCICRVFLISAASFSRMLCPATATLWGTWTSWLGLQTCLIHGGTTNRNLKDLLLIPWWQIPKHTFEVLWNPCYESWILKVPVDCSSLWTDLKKWQCILKLQHCLYTGAQKYFFFFFFFF